MRDAVDCFVDDLSDFRCSYCRQQTHAEDLALAARGDGVIMTCFSCIDRKRTTNNAWSRSAKGKRSIAKSRKKHRAAQRIVEYEVRRAKRAAARTERQAEANLRSAREFERALAALVASWNEQSDVDE